MRDHLDVNIIQSSLYKFQSFPGHTSLSEVVREIMSSIDLFKAVRQLTHWLCIPAKKELVMSTPHKDLTFQIHFQTSLKECGFV